MEKLICLRDDDTNYYTSCDELESAYEDIWGNIPITLGVIPFVHGSNIIRNALDPAVSVISNSDVQRLKKEQNEKQREWELTAPPKDLTDYYSVYPIGANESLVSKLNILEKSGKIEIAQHGVFHRYWDSAPEMDKDRMSFYYVRSGKEYLERVFDTNIKVFIPPSNSIDEKCARFVNDLGMDLFSCGGIRFKTRREKIVSYLLNPNSMFEMIKRKTRRIEQPFGNMCGFFYLSSVTYDFYRDKETVLNTIQKQLDRFGLCSLATHYTILCNNESYRKNYISLIKELATINGVQFVTASSMIKRIKGK